LAISYSCAACFSCLFLLQRRLSDAADAPASTSAVKCDQQLSAKAKPADRSPQADSGDLPEPALDLLAGSSPNEEDVSGAEVNLSLIRCVQWFWCFASVCCC
jgi:hypothetical protein